MSGFYTNVRTFGNNIFARYVENGERKISKIPFSPTLYLKSNKKEEFHSLEGFPLKPMPMGSIKDAKDFIESYKDVENFDVYGMERWESQWIAENYVNDMRYDRSQLVIANIDIEVNSSNGFPYPEAAREPVTSIAVLFNDEMFVFSTKDLTIPEEERDFKYIQFENERTMLMGFLNKWVKYNPDIITGWNIKGFDIPYLVNRIGNTMDEDYVKMLSPWKMVHDKKDWHKKSKRHVDTYELVGVSTIDYMWAYENFTYKEQESYSLDHISYVELGEKKMSYDEHGSLHTLYEKDFDKFIKYNVKDVRLVDRIDKKTKILDLILFLAYQAKINIEDPFFQVRMWDSLIYNKLIDRNIVIPPKKDSEKLGKYVGAFVKEPVPGMYDNVASFDLDSLYPHLMMQYCISPDTFIPPEKAPEDLQKLSERASVDNMMSGDMNLDLLKKYKVTMTPNGQFFSTEKKGFLSEMMNDMYDKRKMYKREMLGVEQEAEDETDPDKKAALKARAEALDLLQLGMKVTLNSAYGTMGSKYFRFYDVRVASAITTSGQLSIYWVEDAINKYFNKLLGTTDYNYVPYMDTDSTYITLDPLIKKVFEGKEVTQGQIIDFMDKVCEDKVKGVIDTAFQNLANYVNAYAQKMSMKREVLASKGFWRSKKNYILNVYDSEGVRFAEPKLKTKGIEIVRSSTPEYCRGALKKSVVYVMEGDIDGLREYIKTVEEEFYALPPEDVAFPRGCREYKKYQVGAGFAKGTPINAKAVINYNKVCKDKGIDKLFPPINEGEKIKFAYLKIPNPIHGTVIGFMDVLPEETRLRDYIDYKVQFEKAFTSPLKSITDIIGFELKPKSNLKGFFK